MADTVYPEVLWAQRSSESDESKNVIYLTINVSDVPKDDLKLDLKPTGLSFTGTSTTLKKTYHVDLEFWAEIVPAESKIHHTAKNIEIKLQKKELDEKDLKEKGLKEDDKFKYWPRLLKDAKRFHFLKTDFDKWVDEDEQNEAPEDDLSQFGGGMGGMPGMGGDFGGIDFSKLGGGGMGMGMGGDDGSDDEDDEEEDEELPALEGDEPKAPATEAPATKAPEAAAAAADKKD